MPDCQYTQPQTIDEVCNLLAQHSDSALLVAGGQNVVLRIKDGSLRPKLLISLHGIEGLNKIEPNNGRGIKIGALTVLQDIADSDLIQKSASALADAAKQVGDRQIRLAGTLGGALVEAHPASDPVTALVALEAIGNFRSSVGEHTAVVAELIEDAFRSTVNPREILTSIEIPPHSGRSGSALEKFALREGDFAIVTCAAALTQDELGRCIDARIVLGNCLGHPVRSSSAEQRLINSRVSDDDIANAAGIARENIEPRSEPMSSGEYKKHLVFYLVRDALTRARDRIANRE